MIGVVVWSNAARSKAVIWCEDQGALAYLEGQSNLCAGTTWPTTGDLLELDCETVGELRYARAVRMLTRQHCVELSDALRDTATEKRDLRLVTSDGRRVDDDDHRRARVGGGPMRRRLAVCS